jgi:hypothetical protein
VATCAFIGLMLIPVQFSYWEFALLIFLNGVGSGLFASPNTSAIMSAVPAQHRGAASGMRATFQNSGMSLSIGIFFSLMITGLAATLPRALTTGLRAHGVPAGVAAHVAHLPPVSTLFAALLGYNPVRHLLAPSGTLARLPARSVAVLTGKQFFPHLISGPFHHGLIIVFIAAATMSLIGAVISLLRGGQFYYDAPGDAGRPLPAAAVAVPAKDPVSPDGQPSARAGRPAQRADARPAGGPGRDPPGDGRVPGAPGVSPRPQPGTVPAGPTRLPPSRGRWRRLLPQPAHG